MRSFSSREIGKFLSGKLSDDLTTELNCRLEVDSEFAAEIELHQWLSGLEFDNPLARDSDRTSGVRTDHGVQSRHSLIDLNHEKYTVAAGKYGSLRTIADETEFTGQLYQQAMLLANDKFEDPTKMLPPFFTDYGLSHMRRVEELLNLLIFSENPTSSVGTFMPNPFEAAFLVASAWLHELGMLYPLFDFENGTQPDEALWRDVRDTHEERTATYINSNWTENCSWAPRFKRILGQIAACHRRKHPISQLPAVYKLDGLNCEYRTIRPQDLASFLRLADACHVDRSRIVYSERPVYDAIGIPEESRPHWGAPQLIDSIAFNPQRREILLEGFVPRQQMFGTANVDLRAVIDSTVASLNDELASVIPYITRYANTSYLEIKPQIDTPVVGKPAVQLLRHMWPVIATADGSTSEVASTIAGIALATVNEANRLPMEDINALLNAAVDHAPFNALLRNLRSELQESYKPQEGAADKAENAVMKRAQVISYLKNYLSTRTEACQRAAVAAGQYVSSDDVVIVYGYSRTVMTLLCDVIRGRFQKAIVVPCRVGSKIDRPVDDTGRMIQMLTKLNSCVKVIEMAAVPGVLRYLKRHELKPKVLLGALEILDDGVGSKPEVIVQVGASLLVTSVKAWGGAVHVVAESEKVLANTRDLEETRRLLKENGDELRREVNPMFSDHAEKIYELSPVVDVLSPEMYDDLITDKTTSAEFEA